MNRLAQILRALFWLPILLAGFTGFTFVAPGFQKFRILGVVLLMLFVVLGVVQSFLERARTPSAAAETSEKRISPPAIKNAPREQGDAPIDPE
jgi:hypothetical protein